MYDDVSEHKIVTNDIFKECTLFGYPGKKTLSKFYINVCCVQNILYNNKLNGNNGFNKISYHCLANGSFNMKVSK